MIVTYRSGSKWAHVSCAIWIPEVTIGCVEKMEPITKISEIPVSIAERQISAYFIPIDLLFLYFHYSSI